MSKACNHHWSYHTYWTDPDTIVSKKLCLNCKKVEDV